MDSYPNQVYHSAKYQQQSQQTKIGIFKIIQSHDDKAKQRKCYLFSPKLNTFTRSVFMKHKNMLDSKYKTIIKAKKYISFVGSE